MDPLRRHTVVNTTPLHTLRDRLIHRIVRYPHKHAHTNKFQMCVVAIYELEDQRYTLLPRWCISKYADYHKLDYSKVLA